MLDLLRRVRRRLRPGPGRPPVLSFGSWDRFPSEEPLVVQICHPDWLGVKTATYSYRSPVIEVADLGPWGDSLLDQIREVGLDLVVIQGWPPGSARFAQLLRDAGIEVKCVLHSSPTQHGGESLEEVVANEVLHLASRKVISEVGMAKAGLSEAFTSAGYPVRYVPNRKPSMPEVERIPLVDGALNVGVLGGSIWRKNLVTQVLAAGMLEDAAIHVLYRPSVDYVDALQIIEHGLKPWPQFLSLVGSVDVNLYVSLSECQPLLPLESYLLGVPCLISRTSSLFSGSDELWELSTVDRLDDPTAIAEQAENLLAHAEAAVRQAVEWIDKHDRIASALWAEFVGSAHRAPGTAG